MALRAPSSSSCPPNSISFNTSLCACNPGFVLNASSKSCSLFRSSMNDWLINSGVDYSLTFPSTIFSFDSIRQFTQSQALFLEATFIMLVSWILFCAVVRIPKVKDGASVWFRIRWWISRLDFCFATRHWLDDQKVVKKRKTELGGTFCVASWILFIGLSAALLYQFISKRSVEIHNVRAANAPDLLTFINDMEFNITTISSMSCSHLRGLGSLVSWNPGSIDYRVFPLSTFANYSCHNTSQGPTITLNCSKCRIVGDDMYISWQYVDLLNDPALAVGFQFNLTAKSHHDRKHVSFVSGILKNGSHMDDRPITFRGPNANIVKFNLFPRIYRNFHDLRIIQPLLHNFLPGSFFLDKSQLQTSLQRSSDGLINMTIFVNFLSAYIVEIENGNILGPVGFFADLGGLYAISFAIFFYLMVQCEYRIKRLRNEDSVLRSIRNRKKALQRWDKLRKYVMYTWGCRLLDEDKSNGEDPLCNCIGFEPVRRVGSLHKRKPQCSTDSISFSKKANLPAVNNAIPKTLVTETLKSCSVDVVAELQSPHRRSEGEHVLGHEVRGARMNNGKENSTDSCKGDGSQPPLPLPKDITLPLPPVPDFEASGSNIPDIRKSLEDLCKYNVMLREKLLAAQSMLEALTKKTPDIDSSNCHT